MPASKPAVALGVTLALGACAVAPPTGPAVLALPPEGKDLARLQQEDGSCRQHAAAQTGDANASRAGLQQRYDLAYAQCMAASGNRLQQALPGRPGLPAVHTTGPYGYPAYYTYPAYYGP